MIEIEFLKEYEKLCQKYKMGISACGCCDSPFLINHENEVEITNIKYNKRLDIVTVEDMDLDKYIEIWEKERGE